jgi:hypothetical protein
MYHDTMVFNPEGVRHLAAEMTAILGGTAAKLLGIKSLG